MGLLSKWFTKSQPEEVNLEDRAPQTGVKYKDLLVLKQLLDIGADMSAPRHVLYYLYFPDSAAAQAAAGAAATQGFTTTIREPRPEAPGHWSLVCERMHYVLSMDLVRENTDYFEEIATRFGGEYDGWEASAN